MPTPAACPGDRSQSGMHTLAHSRSARRARAETARSRTTRETLSTPVQLTAFRLGLRTATHVTAFEADFVSTTFDRFCRRRETHLLELYMHCTSTPVNASKSYTIHKRLLRVYRKHTHSVRFSRKPVAASPGLIGALQQHSQKRATGGLIAYSTHAGHAAHMKGVIFPPVEQ